MSEKHGAAGDPTNVHSVGDAAGAYGGPGMMDSVVSIATSVGEEAAPPSTAAACDNSHGYGPTGAAGAESAAPRGHFTSAPSVDRASPSGALGDDDPPDSPSPPQPVAASGICAATAAAQAQAPSGGQQLLSITRFRPVPFTSSNFVRPLTLLYQQGATPRRHVASRCDLVPPCGTGSLLCVLGGGAVACL